jgi:hypothetical protein
MIADRASTLEHESGYTPADFPYREGDYRNIASLTGLDKLRGVRDASLRRLCWSLYWICEATSPPARVAGDEWRMGDDDFDTSSSRVPPEINGVLRAEWDGFNKKLDRWAAARYRETGVMVSDSEKRDHTSRFAAVCRKRYGASYPEASAPEAQPVYPAR